MSVKTILLCLTSPSSAETLMKAAVPLARRFGAHLVGLHTLEALVVYPAISMHIPSEVYADFNKSQKSQSDEIKAIFDRYTKSEDFVSEWRLQKPDTMTAAARIVDSARAADLVIMAQEGDGTDWVYHEDAIGEAIRNSGRPVLVIPQNFDAETIGENILLGWSATREATRAAHDLLSVAASGAKIGLLTIGKPGDDGVKTYEAIDLAETYDRHGLKVEIVRRHLDGKSVAETILSEAFERGTDLIVTGAFGHSRGYDMIIGAATNDLLKSATIPVLYSR